MNFETVYVCPYDRSELFNPENGNLFCPTCNREWDFDSQQELPYAPCGFGYSVMYGEINYGCSKPTGHQLPHDEETEFGSYEEHPEDVIMLVDGSREIHFPINLPELYNGLLDWLGSNGVDYQMLTRLKELNVVDNKLQVESFLKPEGDFVQYSVESFYGFEVYTYDVELTTPLQF